MSYFSPRACGDKAEASVMTVALTSMMGDADLSDVVFAVDSQLFPAHR